MKSGVIDDMSCCRNVERVEDPMVDYFRKKRTKKAGTKSKYYICICTVNAGQGQRINSTGDQE